MLASLRHRAISFRGSAAPRAVAARQLLPRLFPCRMTKRGPLDRYFTQLPDSKKLKAAATPANKQTGEGGELAKCSSGGNTQPEQQQPATKQNSPGGKYDSAPQSGNADAATTQRQHEASAADTMPTTGTAASGTANAPAATASNGDSTLKVAGSTAPVPAAAGAGGALEALMSAAKGQKTDAAAADRAGQQLTVAQMQEIADRNQAAAQAVVQAATAVKQQPQLKDLLIEPSWLKVLGPEFELPYMKQLQSFLQKEWAAGTIYPPKESVFRAFNTLPFDQVRVVILGQDPYINPGEAMGLSFSVPPGVRIPPSLQNMYKELASDLGCKVPNHGCLEKWSRQGVLLLNASMTVRAKASNSHAGKGWEGLTSAALSALAKRRSGIVFLLWGKFAQDRCAKLDMKKHHVLKSMHPSPLSAHRGFFGCKHFSATNKLLQQSKLPPIDWQIEDV